MTDTGHLGMTLLTAGQSGGETSVNASLSRLDALAQILVKSNDLSTPTSLSPVAGDTYILSGTGSDGWATFAANSIAWYDGGTWFNLLPIAKHEGLLAYIQDENVLHYWTGTAWAVLHGTWVEAIAGHITSPFVKTYVLDEYAAYGYTVNEIRASVGTGTMEVVLSLKIGGTEITGIDSITVTASPTNATASGANVVAATGQLTLVVESLSNTPADLSFTIKITRS